jgi:hypothetical protein
LMRAAFVIGLLGLAGLTFGRPCFAQSEAKTAVAEALYQQARELMAAGKLDQACPKFAESQRLDPATGTLLNLAACHERQGKLATAWLEFSDGLYSARRDGRQDRVDFAAQRIAALEPRVSHLVLTLAPDAEALDLTIELDGASFGRAAIGAPTPVDPGKHFLRATAPGKKPFERLIFVGAEGDKQTLTIPMLEDAPAQPSTTTPLAAPAPGVVGAAVGQPDPGPRRDELAPRPVPASVYIGAGVTAALAVGAGVSGLTYLHERNAYQDGLTTRTTDDLAHQRDTAQRIGYLNLGLWIATACSAGVTTYLYVTRPKQAPSAQLVPLVDQTHAGLAVVGGF